MKRVIKQVVASSRFEYTDKLLDMIDDEVFSAESVLKELLQYLPSDTVEDFARYYVTHD